MKKKFLSKLLTMLLVASMIFTMLPASAIAYYDGGWSGLWNSQWNSWLDDSADEQDAEIATQATDGAIRSVLLDCGRKYFSVDNIKKLIDTMSAYGYNELTLAFSNGGTRFVLNSDEMGLEYDDGSGNTNSVSGDEVIRKIKAGNYAFNKDESVLTQEDMDSIIAYANEQGIEIVPLLNMPGHMNALVADDAFGEYVYIKTDSYGREEKTSSIDISKAEACNFAYALLEKYVEYFASKGCRYFHFGADESGLTGTDMTNFLAGCANIISNTKNSSGEQMTPRAFNDATDVADMPTSVQITYWHQETGSMTASALEQAGYSLINTHGRWYYVIKSYSSRDNSTSKYYINNINGEMVMVELPKLKATKMDSGKWAGLNEFFTANPNNGDSVSNSLGTMFCIWCDASSNDYLTAEQVISDDENYGALYQLQELAGHYWGATGTTDPVGPTTEVDVELEVGESKTFDAGTAAIKDYITGNDAYIATAKVEQGSAAQEAGIEAATSFQAGKKYLLVANTGNYAITNQAKTVTDTRNATGLGLQSFTLNATGVDTVKDYLWTFIENGGKYAIYNETSGKYISFGEANGSLSLSDSPVYFTVTTPSSNVVRISTNNYYLNNYGGESFNDLASVWGTNYDSNDDWYLYEVTEASSGENTLTITGTGENVNDEPLSVTVGNTTYNITVTAPEKEDSLALQYENTKTFNGDVEIVSNDDHCITLAGSTITAGQSDGQATVKVTEKNAGGKVTAYTTYTVTVSEIDFDNIDPLNVQLWSTNQPIGLKGKTADGTWYGLSIELNGQTTVCTPASIPIKANEAYGEGGILLSSKVIPEGCSYDNAGNENEKNVYTYWKGVVLPVGVVQNHANGSSSDKSDKSDKSESGTDFEKIRYYEGEWQYYATETNEWVAVQEGETLIAYYMQRFSVSPELETTTRDWGDVAGQGGGAWGSTSGWVSGFYGIATAVVYEQDYSMSPNGDQAIYDSTLQMRTSGSTSVSPGVIGVSEPSDYRVTKITITKGVHADDSGAEKTATDWDTTDTVKWNKKTNDAGTSWYDETVIWTPEEAGYTGGPIYLDKKVWDSHKDVCYLEDGGKDEALLILIYIEPVKKKTNLTVSYWNDSANGSITSSEIIVNDGVTFANGLRNAQGTLIGATKSWPSGEKGTAGYLPDDAYVENSSGTHRTFNKDITIIESLSPNYRSGVYKYVRAEISDDGKTLTLHYAIDENKLEHTYILDFGLPIRIPLTDLVKNPDDFSGVIANKTLLSDGVTVNTNYGELRYDAEKKEIIYTITKTVDVGEVLTAKFELVYNDNQETKSITIGVIPASNVLYEENFLTEGTTTGGISWQPVSTSVTTAQQTQKVNGDGPYNVFGYDEAYAEKTGDSGYLQLGDAENPLQPNKRYTTLETSFYGNGFDLIGNCGPTTGRVLLVLKPENGNGKVISIDTRYNADTLYQVPLAHVDLGETDAKYTATIIASGLAATKAETQRTNSVAAFAASAAVSEDSLLMQVLAENGLTMADVEYVNMSTADSAAASAASSSAFATYAVTNEAKAIEHGAGTHVEIDGFRVYRSTDNENYPDAEKNIKYVNVLDAVDFEKGSIAYTELDANHQLVSRTDYETTNGGPQNEIYLTKDQSVVFNLGTAMANKTVQISARAVTGTAKLNDSTSISSNTEMYYTVAVGEGGVLAIQNSGEGMLAIANLKVPQGTEFNAVTEDTLAIAEQMLRAYAAAPVDPEPEPQVFEPEHFSIRDYATRLFRSKLVTLRIDFSSDVSYVTIDGVRYNPSRLASLFGYHTVTFTDTIGRNDDYRYEVVFYDANDNPSETQLVYGK